MSKFLRALKNTASNFKKEMSKPTSFIIGDEFEKFIKDEIFPKKEYEMLHETPNHESTSERFNKSAQKPDFQFKDKKTKKVFWVECKFRRYINEKDQIEVLKPWQLKRNQEIKEPVFYLIGLGGKPSNPDHIFEIPHEEIHCNVYLNHAFKFELD